MRTLPATLVSNRKPSWGTMTRAERSEARLTWRRSVPATRMSPVGSASRMSSLARVVLPDPVVPTRATRVPAGSTDTSVRTGGPPW